jgi:hypothetical protein
MMTTLKKVEDNHDEVILEERTLQLRGNSITRCIYLLHLDYSWVVSI